MGLELGAVVEVGEEVFEPGEFEVFLVGALQLVGAGGGWVPPGAGFGQAHGASGGGVGGDDEQRGDSPGGLEATLDGELQCGGEAAGGPPSGGLPGLPAEPPAGLGQLGQRVDVGQTHGGQVRRQLADPEVGQHRP